MEFLVVHQLMLAMEPRQARLVYEGRKSVEPRRVTALSPFDRTYLYEAAPVGMVTGCADAVRIGYGDPEGFWERYGDLTCLTYEEFKGLVCEKDSDWAYAPGLRLVGGYVLTNPHRFETPQPLSWFGVRCAPQNFAYCKSDAYGLL